VDGLDPEVRAGFANWLDAHNLAVVHRTPPAEWPVDAETMLTMPRLDSLIRCVGTVVRDSVAGDLIETGVWRGGACILMRGVLQALGDRARTVWVADSFQGLPQPDPERYPADEGDLFWTVDALAVSQGDVMANFERYGLLDDQVRFLPGWFAETLPSAPIERLAVLRLDGDMYASTMQALEALYPKLSVGGFAVIDDYGAVPGCRAAVSDYRNAHGITEPLVQTDYTEVLWRRER
jgi:O-methyltransferase